RDPPDGAQHAAAADPAADHGRPDVSDERSVRHYEMAALLGKRERGVPSADRAAVPRIPPGAQAGGVPHGRRVRFRREAVAYLEIRQMARSTPPPQILRQIMEDPTFQTNGQFDITKWQRYLGSASEEFRAQIEQLYREYLPERKLEEYLTADVYVSDAKLWRIWRSARWRAARRRRRSCGRSWKTRRFRRTVSSTLRNGSATWEARARSSERRSSSCTANTSRSASWRSTSRPTCTFPTRSCGVSRDPPDGAQHAAAADPAADHGRPDVSDERSVRHYEMAALLGKRERGVPSADRAAVPRIPPGAQAGGVPHGRRVRFRREAVAYL